MKRLLKTICIWAVGYLSGKVGTETPTLMKDISAYMKSIDLTLMPMEGSGAVQKNFVVWMYPMAPSFTADDVKKGETLICPYANACPEYHEGTAYQQMDLKELTEGTRYENYVRDHAFHKIRHFRDFPSHIQVITLLSLLIKNPGGCVRTLGSSRQICSHEPYSRSYDPYLYNHSSYRKQNFPVVGTTSEEVSFPMELLQTRSKDGESMSLIPHLNEDFAIHGIYPGLVDTGVASGSYNAGNDGEPIFSCSRSYAAPH